MPFTAWFVPSRLRGLLVVAGIVALVASLGGLVLGLVLVDSVSDEFEESLGLTESALSALGETLVVIESVADEVDGGLVAAAASIDAASEGAGEVSESLGELADFLDGDLQDNLEAVRRSMPAAVQAAGAIDDTLRALSLLGVNYDPDEPFDTSLMAMQDALSTLPEQLSDQAAAIRGLVPLSSRFADDAAALSGSLTSLGDGLDNTRQLIESYRGTMEQAQGVVDQTGSGLGTQVWLLRLLVVVAGLAGIALSIGMILLSRLVPEMAVPVVAADPADVLDPTGSVIRSDDD